LPFNQKSLEGKCLWGFFDSDIFCYFLTGWVDYTFITTLINGVPMNKLPPIQNKFRIIILMLLSLTLLCGASIPVAGIASAAFTYAGKCYGFTDSVRDCTWWEYAQNEMDFMTILTFMPLTLLALGWLVTGSTWALTRLPITEHIRNAIGWLGSILLILLGLLFVPYVLLILAGSLISLIFG
jgi:hypothetical protein